MCIVSVIAIFKVQSKDGKTIAIIENKDHIEVKSLFEFLSDEIQEEKKPKKKKRKFVDLNSFFSS